MRQQDIIVAAIALAALLCMDSMPCVDADSGASRGQVGVLNAVSVSAGDGDYVLPAFVRSEPGLTPIPGLANATVADVKGHALFLQGTCVRLCTFSFVACA